MSAGGGVPDLVVPVIDITSGATPVSPSRHNSRAKAPALRSVDDDLQLLAGSDDGHFEDVSADVDTAAVLDEAANSPTVGIRTAGDAAFWSIELSSPAFHTMVKDVFWWSYAALMDHRTEHHVLVPGSMTAAMHNQMFRRISEAYIGLCLRITEHPRGITRDNRSRQFLALIVYVIRAMFLRKYRRSFVTDDDPLLEDAVALVYRLFTGNQPAAPSGATERQRRAGGAPSAGPGAESRTVRPSSSTTRRRRGSGAGLGQRGVGGASGAGIDAAALASQLNELMVATDPHRKLPAVVAARGSRGHDDDDSAPVPVPAPLHLPPAVRLANEERDAQRGVVPNKKRGSSAGGTSRSGRPGSGIAAALRDVKGPAKKQVAKRESMPSGPKAKAESKATTLMYSPLVLSTLGGVEGGLTHASRHAVYLTMTNEQNDGQRHAEKVASLAAGFSWDNKRKHVVPAPELPALPTPTPGTHAPHTTPRAMTGTPWCADPSDTPSSAGATDGAAAFLTEPPADPEQTQAEARAAARKEERGKASREAVLRMLHEAKRQADAEDAGPGVETVEDVLQQSKERKARIVAAYQEARTDTKAAVALELMDHKRTLKLVEQVRDTILAHSLGITELSNHLTAQRSFDVKAEQERRERQRGHHRAPQRRRNADDADADIFDPDASPMLPPDERATDAGGQPRKPRRVRLGQQERRNVGANPALMRNMGIVPGSAMSTAQPSTKSLIVELHHRGQTAADQTEAGRQQARAEALRKPSSRSHGRRLRRSVSLPASGNRPPRVRRSMGGSQRKSFEPEVYTTLPNGMRVKGTIPEHLDPVAVGAALKAAAAGKMAVTAATSKDSSSSGDKSGDAGNRGATPEGGGAGHGHSSHKRRRPGARKQKKGPPEQSFVVKFPTPEGVRSRAQKALNRQRQLLNVSTFEVAERRDKPAPMELDVSVNDLMYIPELPAACQATVGQGV